MKPDPTDLDRKRKEIRSAVFDTPWKQCALVMSSGERVKVPHPDFVFVPPKESYLLFVKKTGGFRVIFLDQVLSVDVSIMPPRKTTTSQSGSTVP